MSDGRPKAPSADATLALLDELEEDLQRITPSAELAPEVVARALEGDLEAQAAVARAAALDPEVERYVEATRAVYAEAGTSGARPALEADPPSPTSVALVKPSPRKRSSWSAVGWGASALAAAAAVALLVLDTSPSAPTGLALGRVDALTTALDRAGAPDATSDWISVELTQPVDASHPAVWFDIYRVGPHEALRRLSAETTQWEADGTRHVELRVRRAELVDETDGLRLIVAAASAERALERFDGQSLTQARSAGGITWIEVPVERTQAPQGSLLEHLYRRSSEAGDRYGLAPDGPPRVRIRAADGAQLSLEHDGRPLEVSRTRRGEWLYLEALKWPASTGDLVLRHEGDEVERWALERFDPAAEIPALAEAWRACDRGAEGCLDGAEQLRAAEGVPAHLRFWVEREVGRLAYRGGDRAAARAAWTRSAALAEAARVGSEVTARWRAIGYLDMERGDHEAARARFEAALRLDREAHDERGVARGLYSLAMLSELSDAPMTFLAARGLYAEALEIADARGDTRDAALFAGMLATLLAEFDDYEAARAVLREHPIPEDTSPRRRLRLDADRLTTDLMGWASGQLDLRVADLTARHREHLLRARELGETRVLAFEAARLAQLLLATGAPSAAAAVVREVPSNAGEARGPSGWDLELASIEAAIYTGRHAGLDARLDALDAALSAAFEAGSDRLIALTTLRGHLAAAQGRTEDALRAYLDGVRTAQSLRARLHDPRARTLYGWRLAAPQRAAVALMLAEDQQENAFVWVDHLRFAELEQMGAQLSALAETTGTGRSLGNSSCTSRAPGRQASCVRAQARSRRERDEALREAPVTSTGAPPEAGPWLRDVLRVLGDERGLLSLARLPDGWAAFWARGGALTVATGPDPIADLYDELREVEHVFVVPGASQRAFDLATHPIAGAPLGAQVSMSILPSAQLLLQPRGSADGAALVVVDPQANLQHARRTLTAVTHAFEAPIVLRGAAATRVAIQNELSSARYLHFDGHGVTASATVDDAALLVAEGARIDAAMVFRHRPELRLAVLNGCDTGRHTRASWIGLPQSLLLAGTETVLASTGPVADADAARFIEAFYAAGGRDHPAAAYREIAANAESNGTAAWRSFRIWGRP